MMGSWNNTIPKKTNMTTYNMIRVEIVMKVNSNYSGCPPLAILFELVPAQA
jgi:hypothetical protein